MEYRIWRSGEVVRIEAGNGSIELNDAAAQALGRELAPRRPYRRWSDQEVADIKSAYESGIDCAEIARHHETTANTIQGHLHRMGVPARSQEKSDAVKRAWVARKAAAQ